MKNLRESSLQELIEISQRGEARVEIQCEPIPITINQSAESSIDYMKTPTAGYGYETFQVIDRTGVLEDMDWISRCGFRSEQGCSRTDSDYKTTPQFEQWSMKLDRCIGKVS